MRTTPPRPACAGQGAGIAPGTEALPSVGMQYLPAHPIALRDPSSIAHVIAGALGRPTATAPNCLCGPLMEPPRTRRLAFEPSALRAAR